MSNSTRAHTHAISHHHNLIITENGPNACILAARSPLSGTFNSIDINMPVWEMDKLMIRWRTTRALVQTVFPNLSADEREFILTGISKADWDNYIVRDDEAGEQLEVGE